MKTYLSVFAEGLLKVAVGGAVAQTGNVEVVTRVVVTVVATIGTVNDRAQVEMEVEV